MNDGRSTDQASLNLSESERRWARRVSNGGGKIGSRKNSRTKRSQDGRDAGIEAIEVNDMDNLS